ncbi:MAG: 2-oxo acid dehydrogenase subunit E2 [Bdellovibrionales bacterium]|nr:2-oxo acid dehydrogenase subunit E2 [Bdellovibrionales bacterium]MBT3525030.1 2-oxo acid dehydrogenase subunit E2 [Bdellovibrionales bacterium]MBT7768171.1 2-oxo acid dehydrogenase subunit E2 [Bdellovibrionales bacterium]
MIFEFKFADIGEGVHEGKVLALSVKPGASVEQGDILAEVETDKVVAEIPSSKSGTLVRYGVKEGETIKVGETLAFVELAAGESSQVVVDRPHESVGVVGALIESEAGAVMKASTEGQQSQSEQSFPPMVLATPLARKLASDWGINLTSISGSGPHGRVTKEDLEQRHNQPGQVEKSSSPASIGQLTSSVEELTTTRKTIATNMELSGGIPTATLHELCVIDQLVELRKDLNQGRTNNLGYLPFFIKALAVTLRRFPQFNATFDRSTNQVTTYSQINLGVAVDTEQGLMVPVVERVDSLTIEQINHQFDQLVVQAKERTLPLAKLRGGTFTISNYGSFGGLYGNPLILPPQVGIMGLGRIHQTPVVNRRGEIITATALPISLVIDHRVIDGAPAAQFISCFRSLLEQPAKLLLMMA